MNNLWSAILLVMTLYVSSSNSFFVTDQCTYFPNGIPIKEKGGINVNVFGYIPPDAINGRISINFYNNDGKLLLLHFNPRFDEQIIVRNTGIKGSFDYYTREDNGHFPLGVNQIVDFKFLIDASGYHIYINDKEFTRYAHKLPREILIKNICVTGSLLNVIVSGGGL